MKQNIKLLMLLISLVLTFPVQADSTLDITKKAKQGDSEAQYNLALMYDNGDGIPKNEKKALHWYLESAKQGDSEAQLKLALMYIEGDGTPKNEKKALHWFTESAKQGDSAAQYSLALMYYNGDGIPKNEKRALHWFTESAKQGYSEAQFNLAVMFYKGEGTPKNEKKAYQWMLITNATAIDGKVKFTQASIVKVERRLTPTQAIQIQGLATTCFDSHYTKCD